MWKDGRAYHGQYINDKKHGFGTYQWADGRAYIGNWDNGHQHGEGVYILPNGRIQKGLWHEGKKVRWVEEFPEAEQNNVKANLTSAQWHIGNTQKKVLDAENEFAKKRRQEEAKLVEHEELRIPDPVAPVVVPIQEQKPVAQISYNQRNEDELEDIEGRYPYEHDDRQVQVIDAQNLDEE